MHTMHTIQECCNKGHSGPLASMLGDLEVEQTVVVAHYTLQVYRCGADQAGKQQLHCYACCSR
jgi:hypothetical protein